jgi:hypothetical protein
LHHHFIICLNAAVAGVTPTAMRARPLSVARLAPAHARGQPSDRGSDRIHLCMEHDGHVQGVAAERRQVRPSCG